jgi:death-on-curing protein
MSEKLSPLFYERVKDVIQKRKEVLLKLAEKEFIELTAEEVIEINRIIMLEHKGIFGVRDRNLVESSVAAILNKHLYEGEKNLFALGSVLFFRIIKNHPFIDGNKRTALISLEVFLEQNGIVLDLENDHLYKLAMWVAKGELSEEKVVELLKGGKPAILSHISLFLHNHPFE